MQIDNQASTQRILIGRKATRRAGGPVIRVAFPDSRRLSADHALLTIYKRKASLHSAILAHIFKYRPVENVIETILSFVESRFVVTIIDLASHCGSFIPKNRNRLLGIERFWLMNETEKHSFGIHFLSSPGEFQAQINSNLLLRYLVVFDLVCPDEHLRERIGAIIFSDRQEMHDIFKAVMRNHTVAVLSRAGHGYIFVVDPSDHKISIDDLFEGKVMDGKLAVESRMEVYTSIDEEEEGRKILSQPHRIESDGWLVLGEERCRVKVEF